MQVIFNEVSYLDQSKGKASWQVANIVYSENGSNKKTRLMSFGDGAAAFAAIRSLNPGDAIEVETKKNGDFINWVGVKKVEGGTAPVKQTGGYITGKSTGTWETPEERAKKQVYIIKQSCLAQAVAVIGSKSDGDAGVYTGLAQQFVDWVMEEPRLPPFSDMEDDDISF
jgi:hypothetical protein